MVIKTPDGLGEDDKVIGIIGVAPWSSIDFLNALHTQVKVTKDWHYPRVICDFNTKIPSRGRHFDLGEEDFSPYIKKNIVNLKEQGEEIVVVACNTAHIYFDKWGGW
jgi:aspartate racemase